MGGRNGGRRGGGPVTDRQRWLDVRKLARAGALTPGTRAAQSWHRRGEPWGSIGVTGGGDLVTLIYQCQIGGGEGRTVELPVDLVRTPCGWGGSRPWFLCPRCGRRVALLYLGAGGAFACRHCERLAYQSQRETDEGRTARRIETIRRRLGWTPGFLNGEGPRPKWMHRRTFERLRAAHAAAVGEVIADMDAWLGRQRTGKRP
jgi:hypothetical protein